MTKPNDVPVLIAGGGPVGLALALDLGRRGVPSLIVEREPSLDREILAKADLLNERSMEFCRLLGIADEVANVGFPDDVSRDTVFCTGLNGYFIGRYEMPSTRDRPLPAQSPEMHRRCPQFWFDPLLARAVLGQGIAQLRYGTSLDGFTQDDEGVTCRLRNMADGSIEEIRAAYLVGCDGLTSSVRTALDIPFEGDQLDYSVSVVVRVDQLERFHPLGAGERYLFIGPEGTWANLTSIDGRSLFRFTVLGSEERLRPDQLDMDALLRRAFGRDDIPYELLRALPWRRTHFTAQRFCRGRVFLAGDAAHTMSPTGGHGLNTGLGDVMDLGWMIQALVEGWGGPALGEAYTAERRPVARRNGASSTKNYAMWVDRSGRERVLEAGPEPEADRRKLGDKLVAGLKQEFHSLGIAMGYNYGESPIIIPDGSAAPFDDPSDYVQTARPGHRAPHAWLSQGHSIIDYFGKGFVLLRMGNNAPSTEAFEQAARRAGLPVDIVAIVDERVQQLYERKLVLVRPDGMVAWRADALPDDVDRLVDQVRGIALSGSVGAEGCDENAAAISV
jgi:2-polyprenyl-6-methoxyphenol hydroxylase-like FAD-dependent oxidoreductase